MKPDGVETEVRTAVQALVDWGNAREWCGPDPYEGLNSPVARVARSSLAARCLIQAVKRSPADLRPALRIRPRVNPATLAHVLAAHVRLVRTGIPVAGVGRESVRTLALQLKELRIERPAGAAWAYPFDVQTRFFGYGSETPNTIATSFAGLALLDAYALTGADEILDLAVETGRFFLGEVPQTDAEGGAFFGYLPGDRTPVHNANLLAGAFLAALGERVDEDRFREPAKLAAGYAVAQQRPDGSWPYAEDGRGAWVDGLHTGYVLDALFGIACALDLDQVRQAHRRGLGFYTERLVDSDGAPRALTSSRYPIDSQNAAQAIRTFSLASRIDRQWLTNAGDVWEYAVRCLRRRDGAFVYERHRLWTNPIPHVRWVQAPMLDALAMFLEATGGSDDLQAPSPSGLAPATVA